MACPKPQTEAKCTQNTHPASIADVEAGIQLIRDGWLSARTLGWGILRQLYGITHAFVLSFVRFDERHLGLCSSLGDPQRSAGCAVAALPCPACGRRPNERAPNPRRPDPRQWLPTRLPPPLPPPPVRQRRLTSRCRVACATVESQASP